MHLPHSVLWVKVFVELQDELDQWTDLDNPPGMWEGGREKSAQKSPVSTDRQLPWTQGLVILYIYRGIA